MAGEPEGRKVLLHEARAASIYWKLWEDMPVRFARRNPQRLGASGRWRAGRSDAWLRFGPRGSLLTGKPLRATTPGNSLTNYLYAILETEMTIALLAVGLDPGIGIFHTDIDRRSSLALDAIEAVRPYVDCWLAAYLATSVFANRDFAELPDGEVRLTHPLNSHLAHTAALWRKACEPVARWLARSFDSVTGVSSAASLDTVLADGDRVIPMPPHVPARLIEEDRLLAPLAPPLPGFLAPSRGYQPSLLQSGLKESPVPRMCHECGRALAGGQRKFCSPECSMAFHMATAHEALSAAGLAALAAARAAGRNPGNEGEAAARMAAKNRRNIIARRAWDAQHTPGEGLTRTGPRALNVTQAGLREWYTAELQPHLAALRNPEIAQATGLSIRYAIMIRQGFVPHPRHFAPLAGLAGVPLPNGLLPEPIGARS